jgi:hypothetical protein
MRVAHEDNGSPGHGMRAHTLLLAMGNHLATAMSAGVEPSHTYDRSCLPPFPVPCPGANRCRNALLCYPCSVQMRPAGYTRPSPLWPCRCRDRIGKRQRKVEVQVGSTLAARMSSDLCRRNIPCPVTLLTIYAADAYEEDDGSFHARHHMLLPLCEAVPSAPPHDVPLLAIEKLVYHMPGPLALVAVCQQSEEG